MSSGKKFLRPPGARSEKEFLSRCLQCGQCAQVCIFDCIRMRTGFNPFMAGTPEINPKQAPCHLCMRCSAIWVQRLTGVRSRPVLTEPSITPFQTGRQLLRQTAVERLTQHENVAVGAQHSPVFSGPFDR